MEIKIKRNEQLFSFSPEGLSAFPDEREVVLQDGMVYRVVSCKTRDEQIELEEGNIYKSLTTVILEKKDDKFASMNCCSRYIKLIVN